jgi:glycosyltransferase involved in cell wall biosynthesis
MGKGDEQYEQFLRKEVERLGLTENIEFRGFINGREKFEQLSQLDALFVPSDFENFGMIVTEALACKTPVLASLGTPWEELNKRKCGWWMDSTPENIANVMSQIIDMPHEEIDAMGERGRKLVEEKFTADSVARQMKDLYEWILGKQEKPIFVYE